MDYFKSLTIADKEYTALRFGPDGYDIPTRLMQMTRENGILIRDDDIYEFPWKGITKDTEGQYILFPKCSLESFDTIKTVHRSIAPELLRKVAVGLKAAPKNFISLSSGIFPLYRLLILDGKDVVILPPDCAEILATSRMRDVVVEEVTYLVKPDTEVGYSLIMELSELLYTAAVGVLPYGTEAIRHAGFKEVPISLYKTGLSKETEEKIQSLITMSEKNQRKISGNRKADQNLDYFLDQTENMAWGLSDRTEEEREKAVKETEGNPDFQSIYTSTVNKAKRKDFWRQKGMLIAIVVLVSSLGLYLVGNFFYQKYKPPVTKGFTQEEIIQHVFDCQNALNPNEISAGVKGDVAQFNEVLNIYINSTTRQAYEGINAFVRADKWVAEGCGPVPSTASIYGVIVESIEETAENTYVAHTTWYTPYAYEEEELDSTPIPEGMVRCYLYSVDETFTFSWNKRGWWECTSTEIEDYRLMGTKNVETYEVAANTALTGLNYGSSY